VTTTLRITVDDMTYRDLFQFADLARASHIDPSTKVDWVLPFGLEGELELDGDYRPPLTLDGEEARWSKPWISWPSPMGTCGR
jgi:hypothetical protein